MAPRNFASLARRILRPTQPSPLPKLPIPGTLNRVSLPSQTRECQKPGRFYSQTTLPNMVDVIVCDPRLLFAPFGDPLDPAFSDSVVGPFPIPRHLLQSGALSSPEEGVYHFVF